MKTHSHNIQAIPMSTYIQVIINLSYSKIFESHISLLPMYLILVSEDVDVKKGHQGLLLLFFFFQAQAHYCLLGLGWVGLTPFSSLLQVLLLWDSSTIILSECEENIFARDFLFGHLYIYMVGIVHNFNIWKSKASLPPLSVFINFLIIFQLS